jgi:type VI protein secretion system component Hcp
MARSNHFLQVLDSGRSLIKGESEGHQPFEGAIEFVNSIDVTAWDWKVSNDADKPVAASAGAAPAAPAAAAAPTVGNQQGVVPDVLTFHKVVDKSTIRLLQAMNSREPLTRATFTIIEYRVAAKGGVGFRLEVVLDKPVVTSYSLSASSSDFRVELEETWELGYNNIAFNYVSAGGVNADFDRPPGSPTVKKQDASQIANQAAVKALKQQLQQQSKASAAPDHPSKKVAGKR